MRKEGVACKWSRSPLPVWFLKRWEAGNRTRKLKQGSAAWPKATISCSGCILRCKLQRSEPKCVSFHVWPVLWNDWVSITHHNAWHRYFIMPFHCFSWSFQEKPKLFRYFMKHLALIFQLYCETSYWVEWLTLPFI